MKIIFLFITIVMLITSCSKDNVVEPLPDISISEITNIDVATASYSVTISSDGGSLVTDRGICWNSGTIPTVLDNKKSNGEGAGAYTGIITGLTPNTQYYVRTFATNHGGTIYGSTISFTTLDGAIDVDGNIYHAVTLGTQTWLVENLRTTKYNDGTPIPLVTGSNEWFNNKTGAFTWYNIDALTVETTYGGFYNWYAVNTGKLCPTGWHVPSDNEWSNLEIYLQNHNFNFNGFIDTDNYDSTNNYVAKSIASQSGWMSTAIIGTAGNTDYPAYRNKSGFTAFPGGYIYEERSSLGFGNTAYWWSSSEIWTKFAWIRGIFSSSNGVYRDIQLKNFGLSVRCVKD